MNLAVPTCVISDLFHIKSILQTRIWGRAGEAIAPSEICSEPEDFIFNKFDKLYTVL